MSDPFAAEIRKRRGRKRARAEPLIQEAWHLLARAEKILSSERDPAHANVNLPMLDEISLCRLSFDMLTGAPSGPSAPKGALPEHGSYQERLALSRTTEGRISLDTELKSLSDIAPDVRAWLVARYLFIGIPPAQAVSLIVRTYMREEARRAKKDVAARW